MKRPEGAVGTWSHCGNHEKHGLHIHAVTVQEGTFWTVKCLGTPDTYRRHTATTKPAVRRQPCYGDWEMLWRNPNGVPIRVIHSTHDSALRHALELAKTLRSIRSNVE